MCDFVSSVVIDKTYIEAIKAVTEWMVDEYADYPEVTNGCIHSAEMLIHAKQIKVLLNDMKDNRSISCDHLYYLNYAVNDLICNSYKCEKLENISADNLKALKIYLEKLMREE